VSAARTIFSRQHDRSRERKREREGGASLAIAVVIAFALVPLLDGCDRRRVVVEPDAVLRANDHAWKITSEPGQPTTSPPSATPTAPSAARNQLVAP
jgi:hypothetical protein